MRRVLLPMLDFGALLALGSRLPDAVRELPERERNKPGYCKCGKRISLNRDACLACKNEIAELRGTEGSLTR